MIAAQDGSDRSDCAASFSYEDFWSVLMYYGHMSKKDILHSSRRFLNAVYQNYVKRACENLGVSSSDDKDENGNTELSDSEYPNEFITFSQKEREKAIEESNESDSDFLNKFSSMINC